MSDILEHVGYKALTLDLHPELPVEHPGAAPAVRHVLYELPAGEVLAQPMSNNLVLVFSQAREKIKTEQKQFREEEEQYQNCCENGCKISDWVACN